MALDSDIVPEDDADRRKPKVRLGLCLPETLKEERNNSKLDADVLAKTHEKALDGIKPENATVWDDAMRWTIRRDGKFIVGYDFITLCK